MDDARVTRISKYLSKHLRHAPAALGLALGPGGWVAVDDLLQAAARHGFHFSREELDEVVATNNKQRFAFDATGTQIRANQGHSVPIDLELEPQMPPPILYHGTGAGSVAAIQQAGLLKMRRHAVHLSADQETAQRVGARHGRPVVFAIDAAALHAAGHVFYCAANGVWLTEAVPPAYLRAV
ncbi:MAG: RNA 2'-phosphotransferase [Chloroflexota bacterium]|nr:RNA 2'-phosphotransferase [Chloroflexota bacterium]